MYNLNFSGHMLVVFPVHINTDFDSDVLKIINYIKYVNAQGHIEDIKDMFIIPMQLIETTDLTLVSFTYQIDNISYSTSFYNVHATHTIKEETFNLSKTTSFTDYTPKNNKCFCYPYNYIAINNNYGNFNMLRYEDFGNTTVDLKLER